MSLFKEGAAVGVTWRIVAHLGRDSGGWLRGDVIVSGGGGGWCWRIGGHVGRCNGGWVRGDVVV